MTTVPPFDSSRLSLFAGLAATSAGATTLGGGGAAATFGFGAAAINAIAANGSANRALLTNTLPDDAPPVKRRRCPAYEPPFKCRRTSSATAGVTNLSILPPKRAISLTSFEAIG